MTGWPPGSPFERDVVVIGGCGHAGLPLSIALADRGSRAGIYDVSETAVSLVSAARMPFGEPGAADALRRAVAEGRLEAPTSPAMVATAEHVIVVAGTPVDEYHNPDQAAIAKALGGCLQYLRDGQILILRSTVYPGVTAKVEKMAATLGLQMDVAFCPERIAEGKAMAGLCELPQKAGGAACSDPYVTTDPHLRPLGEVLSGADLLIIGAPHPEYRDLATDKPVAGIWNVLGKGIQV